MGIGYRRITPARAGKSSICTDLLSSYKDHPRPRGEKSAVASVSLSFSGSPPPARGKEMANGDPFARMGITPARAGKSDLIIDSFRSYQDHPRPRGEKYIFRRMKRPF